MRHVETITQGTLVKRIVRSTCSCGWRSQAVDSRRIGASAWLREAFRMHKTC